MKHASFPVLRVTCGNALCALLLLLLGPQAFAKDESIVLKRADGKSVEVPLVGPRHDARAEQLAREIQALDRQIDAARKALPKSVDGKPAADPVKDEMLVIATESRNEALADLDLALTVASKTSAGSLDDATVARAKEGAASATTVLNTQPPGSIFVSTKISTSVPDAALHYMSNQKHRQRSTEWSSYSEGERLRIGRYVFRVQPEGGDAKRYEELVLVISDPTEKRLTPVRDPGQ